MSLTSVKLSFNTTTKQALEVTMTPDNNKDVTFNVTLNGAAAPVFQLTAGDVGQLADVINSFNSQ